MTLPLRQSCAVLCYILPHRHKYHPLHPMLLPQFETQ